MIDRWDGVGACGAGLVAAGVWARFGWPWASILVGLALLVVYVLHEARKGVR